MSYIICTPDGEGCFLSSEPIEDLATAKAATPPGGHVEMLTDIGSIIVFQN